MVCEPIAVEHSVLFVSSMAVAGDVLITPVSRQVTAHCFWLPDPLFTCLVCYWHLLLTNFPTFNCVIGHAAVDASVQLIFN